jgi:hypothetical protein
MLSRERFLTARGVLETNGLHNGSLMEIAATAKVLDTIPPLRPFPGIVAAAARLGGSYDDFFDCGIDRQVAAEGGYFEEDYSYMVRHRQAVVDFLREVGQSSLEEDEKVRIAEASRIFTSNTTCLIWAVFFGALGSERVQLESFGLAEGINAPKNHYSKYLTEENREARWVQKLYYGAVVYQFVGDWISRRINRGRFIPGLGSLNQRNEPLYRPEYRKLLDESIAEARGSGMKSGEEALIRFAFPFLRFLANLRVK